MVSSHTGSHVALPPEKPRKKRSPARKKTAKHAAAAVPAPPSPVRHAKKRRIYAFIAIGAALAVVAAAVLGTAGFSGKYEKYYSAAGIAYADGNYDDALSQLRRAAGVQETEECLLLMADCYEAQQNYDRALEILRGLGSSVPGVNERMSRITDAVHEIESRTFVTVAGEQYPQNTTVIVLDSMGLDDGVLQELLSLYSLETLSISSNSLRDVSALAGLGGMTNLNLSGNSISDLSPLSALTGLRMLYLDSNPVTDFTPLYSLENLSILSIRGINISPEQLEALSRALPSCAIQCERPDGSIVDLTLGGKSFVSDVKELDLSGCGLTDISALAVCSRLETLHLSGNSISDISPLTELPRLKYLDISDNDIRNINPLIGMTGLRYLNLAGNSFSSTAAIGALTSLDELHLERNIISDFSGLKKLTGIDILVLADSGLYDDALESMYELDSLKYLDISSNSALTADAVLVLKNDIPGCTVIHSDLPSRITLGEKTVLDTDTEADLSGQGASDISAVKRFRAIEKLNLENNCISSVYDLSSCYSLTELDLSGNRIEDVSPLGSLCSLRVLDLAGNRISSVELLMNMKWLTRLDLTGNSISEEDIRLLRESLPECEVIF